MGSSGGRAWRTMLCVGAAPVGGCRGGAPRAPSIPRCLRGPTHRARARLPEPADVTRATGRAGGPPRPEGEPRGRRPAGADRRVRAHPRRPDRRPVGAQGLRLPELLGQPRTASAAAPTWSTSALRAGPARSGFIPAPADSYHGEGAHAISLNLPGFRGDVLAVNNETYGSNVTAPCSPTDKTGGGFDLYDVTNPANPRPLVQSAGDIFDDEDPTTPLPHEGHLLPLGVRLAGRAAGVPRGLGQHRGHRPRHLRHHQPAGAGADRRRQPVGGLPAGPRARPRTATRSCTTTWS